MGENAVLPAHSDGAVPALAVMSVRPLSSKFENGTGEMWHRHSGCMVFRSGSQRRLVFPDLAPRSTIRFDRRTYQAPTGTVATRGMNLPTVFE
jgi:hypothetical protein